MMFLCILGLQASGVLAWEAGRKRDWRGFPLLAAALALAWSSASAFPA
jgi:hypothetical protein